ncbi:MAG: hypothetical protein R3240_04720, partial [Gammaproteobacteria bacterium]|nr:hypothetical protein [Gammaproteobacteria bacterium]
PISQEKLPQNLLGKRILVTREQGLGDELFFLRFVTPLIQRGARIHYFSSEKLAPLLKSTQQSFEVIEHEPNDFKAYDFVVSVADLPLVSGETSPINPLKLSLDASQQQVFKARFFGNNPPVKRIGISWRAGLTRDNAIATTLKKSIPLEQLVLMLKDFDGEILVLQRQPQAEEIRFLKENLQTPVHDFSHLNDDLLAMTYMLQELDDYIAVSNTNMHIRGCLGQGAGVLIPFPPEWRWGISSNKTDWYSDFELFRQDSVSGWKPVIPLLQQRIAGI